MRAEIVEGQVRALRAAGLDALVCTSPENVAYTTGFVIPSQPLMRWRYAATVVTAEGGKAMLVVDMEESTVRARVEGVELRAWGEFTDDPMAVLADLLRDLGLARAAIGVEMDHLPAGALERLRTHLADARFAAAETLLARMRQLKTGDEVALLTRLSRLADEAITDALASVRAGDSEMDIAAAMTRNVYAGGAEQFKLMIVATGERSVFPNVGPSERRLRRGDVCRVEIFPVIQGYHAGVCRTAIVQEAPPHAERIWATLVECKYRILEMMRPGASSRAIYEDFIARLRALDLPPISFVGHGIGLHLHERPYLGGHEDVPLEAGMVLGIEPLCYRTGHGFGMQNKDMVLVTETGSQLLSDYADTDRLLVVS